jgi:hypothetical protein
VAGCGKFLPLGWLVVMVSGDVTRPAAVPPPVVVLSPLTSRAALEGGRAPRVRFYARGRC